ncbi:succinate-semialdehyde dehydrogenase [Corynebacterium phocae]|uniref:Succinate-semialdehyde dehydrogenase n=1 Tax=Corynebacterium phocae TaxID=161895 RepID=A0A1L7D4Q3_9CORY|nr:NAD-dependent succinate-semialdehyde dehydrogenase [Corynebacterium phocae]APT93119.1 succinate-semialdehyde dehydrogenase [Corynebacterium phocae]KAA8722194.1 NAD-dependent succinate-semialdehyde dehydrogenase [Corynebacterium phocae]
MIENLWLGTKNVPAESGKTFTVLNPATEEVLAEVADGASADWMKALDLAHAAQKPWAAFAPQARHDILMDLFHAVMERKDEFATLMVNEMGKTWKDALAEVDYGAAYLRWFAGEAIRLPGRYAASPAGNGTITVRPHPVGPCLAITPWNFPLAMATRKIAPALAAGCTMIVKPAAATPLTMLAFGEVVAEVFARHDVPHGTLSFITSTDSKNLSKELMDDPRLRKVTFTGSTKVGQTLVEQSAKNLQRTTMELGGNAPFIVCADADMDRVIKGLMVAKMRNNGQTCIAANRFLVHSSRVEEFQEKVVDKFQSYVTGYGMDETTTLGPLVNAEQRDHVAKLVDQAIGAGATALTGGFTPQGPGFFYPATVLTDVKPGADILKEEIFGPVAVISTFESLDEAIERANDTKFGLAAYAFSENAHTVARLANELQAGMVGLNRGGISDVAAPFGGIKASGFGREGGAEGIDHYLELHYVAQP